MFSFISVYMRSSIHLCVWSTFEERSLSFHSLKMKLKIKHRRGTNGLDLFCCSIYVFGNVVSRKCTKHNAFIFSRICWPLYLFFYFICQTNWWLVTQNCTFSQDCCLRAAKRVEVNYFYKKKTSIGSTGSNAWIETLSPQNILFLNFIYRFTNGIFVY